MLKNYDFSTDGLEVSFSVYQYFDAGLTEHGLFETFAPPALKYEKGSAIV